METLYIKGLCRNEWISNISITKSIQHLSHTGYYYECFDKIICLLFPLIFILSANYEEQCVSAINLSLLQNPVFISGVSWLSSEAPMSNLLSAQNQTAWFRQDFLWVHCLSKPDSCWTCYASPSWEGRKAPQEWIVSYPSTWNGLVTIVSV